MLSLPVAVMRPVSRLLRSCALSVRRQSLSTPTSARRMTSALWSTETVARFGRLDVAVNNAGTEGQVGPITDQTAESYAATFDTNVLGAILSMKHEVRVMQGQGSGSIINISSTYGHEGAAGASVYVGSKHAVEGITKSVALETVKSGIRVNSVAPGPIDTGMLTRFTRTPENKAALVTTVPMHRLGLSEEVANAIVFIASDQASFITGHVLNVDGGKSH